MPQSVLHGYFQMLPHRTNTKARIICLCHWCGSVSFELIKMASNHATTSEMKTDVPNLKRSTHGIENLKMYVPADLAGGKVTIVAAIPSMLQYDQLES